MPRFNAKLGKTIFLWLLLRISLLLISSAAIIFLADTVLDREKLFTFIIGGILIVIQIKSLTDYVLRINSSLVQFVDFVGKTDADDIRFKIDNSMMSDFELRINLLKEDIKKSKLEGQKQKSLLKIAVDELEPGLICVKNNSEVIFTNKSLQKLLKGKVIDKFSELESAHPELDRALATLCIDAPGIISLPEYKASVRCKEFRIGKDDIRLYSVQDIQHEIDKNEIESWERLIKVLTHEIMNSLSPIISLSKSMQRSMNDSGKIATGLSAIENTGEGLINFISEYRKLSDLPSPEKERFEIKELFDNIRSLLEQECKKNNISLKINLKDQRLKLYADKFQIEQVLINMITNSIEILDKSRNGSISLTAFSQENKTAVIVEDNGPGIPRDIREKIFIPFFSTKKKGIGIGLSLSKQIISNHDAMLKMQSTPGESTKFIMKFK